jgi:peptide/nickel transport system substrate-binding protein
VEENLQKEALTAAAETPQYGGALTLALTTDTTNFDEGVNRLMSASGYAYDELSTWDWARGPSGTGELDFTVNSFHKQEFYAGTMAESWEYKPPDEMVLHIRQGVHYGLNPTNEASRLVNGREMTADDVVFTLKRLFTEPNAYLRVSYPNLAAVIKITAPDKYTVDIKVTPDEFMEMFHTVLTFDHIVAPEVVQKYGNVNGFKLQVGTGPFMPADYIPGSFMTYIKNPAYWQKDPVGPGKGMQLPYIDRVNLLVIPDVSTRQAALRTGKLDMNSGYSVEDKKAVVRNSPKLNSLDYPGSGGSDIAMHIYDPKLPFKDVRVRQAMMLAIDYKTIVRDYFQGAATYENWPHRYQKGYDSIMVPLAQMPASVQELYSYNPDKSRQLLKEAGYPAGFKTSVVLANTTANIDYMSVIKEYWSKVGIDLTIDPRETAVYNNLWQNFTYSEMVAAGTGGIGSYYRLIGISGPDYWNPSQVNEPYIEAVREKMANIILTTLDWKEVDRLYRDLMPRVLEQAYMIPGFTPSNYVIWWPWLKNYQGEMNTSFAGGGDWEKFVWLDQDLKKAMGY